MSVENYLERSTQASPGRRQRVLSPIALKMAFAYWANLMSITRLGVREKFLAERPALTQATLRLAPDRGSRSYSMIESWGKKPHSENPVSQDLAGPFQKSTLAPMAYEDSAWRGEEK